MSDNNIAFVFPGQGSQTVGMLADLYQEYDVVKQTFAKASDALGYDLWALVAEGPAEELNKTHITQPALLTASIAIFEVLREKGVAQPALIAGHSLGEYSALVAAQVIKFEDAVKLVELRGQLMQEAVPAGTGAMYAIIGLADDKVKAACEEAAQGEVVSAVNFNSPGQVVIAGQKEAVERAGALCKEAGAKRALPLPVSVPSHCALMKPAADKLAEKLAEIEFSNPSLSVINNVDVAIETEGDAIRDALVRQLYCPVRWTESVEQLAAQGISQLVEVGPGKVLAGLTKRINKSLSATSVNDIASIESFISE
ncbi:[acyl-carrier-protein] S-malonyltransferase [Saccharobesus litoralis]|uniref:Malonyl CoA-acyl carrier protein transacylase n=1 Tax=Saccharobesus litoralis TaxID=2172099 RepID=A0A2S0VP18_9ALTE|nr:ACP S-malonyltransferase [Saccharobesus litoralis]AWB65965.1 [acyl-carrier-protein] S-malonyltransferase [Saccharobesus litoralis]